MVAELPMERSEVSLSAGNLWAMRALLGRSGSGEIILS
jgi:hypothetical protein